MSFNDHQPPLPPPNPAHLLGVWSDFHQNLAGLPLNHGNHESLQNQYGCSSFEHSETPAQKRARQSDDNLPNVPNVPPLPRLAFDSRMNPPLPPGRGGTGHMFYKTRLCVKFSLGTGSCRNGDSCNFAHGVHDLRQPPPNWKELIGGNGGGGALRVEHRRNRNVCEMYYTGQECPYGEKCAYLHERDPASTPSLLDEGGGQLKRESAAITIGFSSNQGRTGGYIPETDSSKSKSRERNHFDIFQTGSYVSRSRNEGDAVLKSCVIQSKPSVSAPLVDVAGDAIQVREKADNASRWKLNKKVNRIYADWLDDLSPPRNVVSEAET